MSIPRRRRHVRFIDGLPVVRVSGREVVVKHIVQDGTDNPKTKKNANVSYMPAGVVMSPARSAGIGINVCRHAGVCVDTCLDSTGRGAATGEMGLNIHTIRIARTVLWRWERQYFLDAFHADVEKWEQKAERAGKTLCIRPNMFSDIDWELYGVPQAFPNVQWYDYTKNPKRAGAVLPNYWVTFSRDSHKDDELCMFLLSQGKNVAIAFDDGRTTGGRNLHGKGRPQPKKWNGFKVFCGDDTDARWLDPTGVVVGLTLKSHSTDRRIHAINSGFAVVAK